jgi:hypothetical protein
MSRQTLHKAMPHSRLRAYLAAVALDAFGAQCKPYRHHRVTAFERLTDRVTPNRPWRSAVEPLTAKDCGEPGWVGNVPTPDLRIDAPSFQLKQNAGQDGACQEFRKVEKSSL